MDAVADRVRPGSRYVGVVQEGDQVDFAERELPNGGVDIADVPVYWLFPSGHVECWSVQRLVDARPDELAAEEGEAEYMALAQELGFRYLGHALPEDLTDLLQDPGTLADLRWTDAAFQLSPDTLAG